MITLLDSTGYGFDITPEEGEALRYAIEHDTLRQSTLTTLSESLQARLNGSSDDIMVYDTIEQTVVYLPSGDALELLRNG